MITTFCGAQCNYIKKDLHWFQLFTNYIIVILSSLSWAHCFPWRGPNEQLLYLPHNRNNWGGGGGGGGDWLRWWRGVPRGRSDLSKSGDYCNVQLTWHSECQPRQHLQTNTDINEPCTTSLLTCSYPLGRNQMTISWSDLLYWGPARGWRAVIPRLQGWWVRSKKFKLCRSLEVLLCCLN